MYLKDDENKHTQSHHFTSYDFSNSMNQLTPTTYVEKQKSYQINLHTCMTRSGYTFSLKINVNYLKQFI